MLTSIYYYDYYKPYIFSTENTAKSRKIGKPEKSEGNSRFSGIDTKEYIHSNNESFSYFLNYSDKNEVKSVVSGISENVNGIKDTARYLQNVKKGRNAKRDGGQSAYGDGLEDFASDFNSLVSFAEGKNVSDEIKGFSNKVSHLVGDNGELLREFGVSVDGDTVEFDRSVYNSLSRDEYEEKSAELNKAFAQVYSDAVDVLSKPMSSHLKFKNLDYYYNYGFSAKDGEPFRFLDTGLIVDITL